MRQILAQIPSGYTVIIVGDQYKDPRSPRRYDEIVRQPPKGVKVFNLTEFWNNLNVKSWGGDTLPHISGLSQKGTIS